MTAKTLAAIIKQEAEECAESSHNMLNPPEAREAFAAITAMLRSLHEKVRTCQEEK